MMIGNKSGPCPNCGGTGSIPDGLYEFVDETLNIVSTWPQERIERLLVELQGAKSQPDPRAAAEAVIASDEDLVDVAKRLLIPRDAGQFWAFVGALLAALALVTANRAESTIVNVNVQTVVERIIGTQPAPTTHRPKPPVERRDIPKQPKKRRKKHR